MSKKITVLFDAENVTASFIPSILDFIQSKGDILIQRAYADWSFQGSKEWKSMLDKYPISAFQQFHHGEKQAVDKAIIMDAIELAIRHPEIDTFCIIASDSGYSPLALRLRELEKYVIGVGETEKIKKESSLFINSYNEFKYADKLNVVETELKLTDDDKKDNNMDEFILAQFIEQAYNATPKNDGIVLQSRLVESIKRQKPDFDYHDYKYTAWNKMFEALDFSVELDADGNTYRVIKQETEDEIFKEGEIFRIIGSYGIIKAENLDYFFYKGSLLPQFRNEKIKKGDKVRFQVAKKPDNEAQKNRDKNGKAINIEILKENEIS
ncbi:MAG: NYN domain-containing protein [Treponema sp.]|nr:NYN domain-containing protein [Treponema sp.]